MYSWKLGRSRSPLSASANERIDEVVTQNVDLYEGYYEYTDQSNDGCFYYPVFEETPESIVLPGPCDDRIQAKANFDAGAVSINLNLILQRLMVKLNQYSIVSTDDFFWIPTFLVKNATPHPTPQSGANSATGY